MVDSESGAVILGIIPQGKQECALVIPDLVSFLDQIFTNITYSKIGIGGERYIVVYLIYSPGGGGGSALCGGDSWLDRNIYLIANWVSVM
jgi:hypothetical protein